MQKPTTVARREFSEAVVEVVNGSGLPFFVIRQLLEGLLSAVRQGEYEAYLRERAAQETDDRTDAAEGGKEGAAYGSGDDSDIQGQARDVRRMVSVEDLEIMIGTLQKRGVSAIEKPRLYHLGTIN